MLSDVLRAHQSLAIKPVLVLVDHNSTDETAAIAESAAVTVWRDGGDGFRQGEMATQYARRAIARFGPEWISCGDGDEIFSFDPRDAIATTVHLPVYCLWPHKENMPFHRIRHYSKRETWIENGENPKRPGEKHVIRVKHFSHYRGPHDVVASKADAVHAQYSWVKHYVAISLEHLIHKMNRRRRLLLAQGTVPGDPTATYYLRRLIHKFDQGKIDRAWWHKRCRQAKGLPIL